MSKMKKREFQVRVLREEEIISELAERNRRWGIVHTEGDTHLQLIDRKRALHDGHNHMAVSELAIDWIDQQPETRIPGVIEMLFVHLLSHRTGITGGIGSEDHEIACGALKREKATMTQPQLFEAVKACTELFKRAKKQWPNSNFTLPPEPAATPEEVIEQDRRQHEA